MSTNSKVTTGYRRRDNISTIFLLPCLQIKQDTKDRFYSQGFVNTYLFFDKTQYEYFTPLYLLFKPEAFNIDFYKFMLQLEKNQNYIETLDYPNGQVVFVFRIPKRYDRDYRLFLSGKYSRFSKEFKNNFPLKVYKVDHKGTLIKGTNGWQQEDSIFYHIFNKTEYLKDIYRENLGSNDLPEELYDKYKPEEENLIIDYDTNEECNDKTIEGGQRGEGSTSDIQSDRAGE